MKRLFSKRISGLALLLTALFVIATPRLSIPAKQDEYRVKAAFVLNFAKLTVWPAGSVEEKNTFPIAILGKSPSETFSSTLQSLAIHGYRVTVRHITSVEEARNYRLLFITVSERHRLSGILKELRHLNVLTVSDISGFCESGGMIGMVMIQNRIGFEVNLTAVRRSRLSISSQLLKLAKTVYGN